MLGVQYFEGANMASALEEQIEMYCRRVRVHLYP